MRNVLDKNLIIITGSSGAGRTTAINALEDRGFEIIDNIPISMIDDFVLDGSEKQNIALGIDVRTRDFSSKLLKSMLIRYEKMKGIKAALFFLECEHNKLLSRFNETRRRHPLSGVKSLSQALKEETLLLKPLKLSADVVIDTTDYSPNQLREELLRRVRTQDSKKFTISIVSFSFKGGLPRNLDMVYDCRFLKNPYWERELRDLDGNSELVRQYIIGLDEFGEFQKNAISMLEFLIPLFKKEGKTDFSLGIGCTGGKHRSVVVANELKKLLECTENLVFIRHQDLNNE